MGTCVGKRNLKYFISFLFMTAIHAFITATICIIYYLRVTSLIEEKDFDRNLERMMGMLSIGVGLYAAIIGFTLLLFGMYTSYLAMDNVTSNESIRSRWNARHEQI